MARRGSKRTAKSPAKAAVATGHPLEAVLEADPDDDASFLVYTDHLLAEGDPRGELAAVQRALETRRDDALLRREHELLDRHRPAMLGMLAELPGYRVRWRYGHVDRLEIAEPYGSRPGPGEAIADLLHRPAARFLREVAIRHSTFPPAQEVSRVSIDYVLARAGEVVSALAAAPRPALRAIELGEREIDAQVALGEEGRDYLSHGFGDVGNLERLWRAAPRLERVLLSGGWMELGSLALPAVRDFELRQSNLRTENLHAMLAARWPTLERLSLWIGAHDNWERAAYAGAGPSELAPLLDPRRFPALRSLGLVSTMNTHEVLDVVLRSELLPQLTELDLGGGTLGDNHVAAIVRARSRLAHLTRLDLRWNLFGLETARRAFEGTNVVFDPQRFHRSYLQPRFNACQE
ncbi:MAG TPA: hypothetical protein VFQ53_33320 [Kofleriaceae bacterium]|nr:hypothetical protein [Kofleriaceae bacterium]